MTAIFFLSAAIYFIGVTWVIFADWYDGQMPLWHTAAVGAIWPFYMLVSGVIFLGVLIQHAKTSASPRGFY